MSMKFWAGEAFFSVFGDIYLRLEKRRAYQKLLEIWYKLVRPILAIHFLNKYYGTILEMKWF